MQFHAFPAAERVDHRPKGNVDRRIEIGLAFDGLVHVRSGLTEGERVVVRGNESLREGQTVRPAS